MMSHSNSHRLKWIFVSFAVSIGMTAIGGVASAATKPVFVKPGAVSPPLQAGAVTGGQADLEFSLIGVRAESTASGGGRLVLSYGDRLGHALTRAPGYFHVALDRGGRRLSIDLAQLSSTAVDPKQLSKLLAPLGIVTNSEMTMDPQDISTNITIALKNPVEMKVATTAKRGQLIIELRPLRIAQRGDKS